MRTILAAACLALALSACKMGPPTEEERAAADYGAPITQEDAEAQANGWLDRHLKDPDSAQAEWGPVSQGWAREPVFDGGDLMFGYSLEGMVNAKNSFGGYVGAKPYSFLFRDGQMIAIFYDDYLVVL